jgi:hypothetical protein
MPSTGPRMSLFELLCLLSSSQSPTLLGLVVFFVNHDGLALKQTSQTERLSSVTVLRCIAIKQKRRLS